MRKIIIPISGMHCASCAQKIEATLKKLNGITKASVNFATEKATVEFNEALINENEINNAIEQLGYKVIKVNQETEKAVDREKEAREKEIRTLKSLFLFSLLLSIPIFLISMPFELLNIEIPYKNIILLLLATPVQFVVV
ncbi:MAG: cation transporter [Leptonema sp. (in: bacteria)]